MNIVFATYVETPDNLPLVCRLAESLRTFGGTYRGAPLRVYVPSDMIIDNQRIREHFHTLHVEVKRSDAPEEARWLYYAGKVYAAAKAEAESDESVLVWVDADTVILDEPAELDLPDGKDLAWCPVMHNRLGVKYDHPPNDFWRRIYDQLSLTDDMLFPMITPADNEEIKAYFHCGLIAVRPERNILRQWAADFKKLYTDPELAAMCRADTEKRIFLHQTALTGAILHILSRDEMHELSDRYNYPVFFEKQYGGGKVFDSIERAVTARCLVSEEKMGRDWHTRLNGSPEKIAWLRIGWLSE